MEFYTPQAALDYIKEHVDSGLETNINGDVFFGVGPGVYMWADIAKRAGVKELNPKVPIGGVNNSAFHHFRDDSEILGVLSFLLEDEGYLETPKILEDEFVDEW